MSHRGLFSKTHLSLITDSRDRGYGKLGGLRQPPLGFQKSNHAHTQFGETSGETCSDATGSTLINSTQRSKHHHYTISLLRTAVAREFYVVYSINKVTRLVSLLARSTVCKESSATERSDVCGHPWCRCRLAVANASSDADRRSWQGDQCSPVDILLHVLVQRTHLRHWSTKESQRNRWSDRV